MLMLGRGREAVLHLLVPTEERLHVSEPLHSPGEVWPFRLESETRRGWSMGAFNISYAIGRSCFTALRTALRQDAVAMVTSSATVLLGTAGISLACGAATGGYIRKCMLTFTIAAMVVGPMVVVEYAGDVAEVVRNFLALKAPRIVGSNRRLEMIPEA